MGMNFELDWEIANYRTLSAERQAQLRADALRRAHALRHEEFGAVFRALTCGIFHSGRALVMRLARQRVGGIKGKLSTELHSSCTSRGNITRSS